MRDHGCAVQTSLSKSHAHELLQSQSFDVLVCGSSLTPEVCQDLAEDFRARNPQGKVIEILAANWKAPMNKPDAVALSPEELIAVIRGFVGADG